ncbi:peptide ABC transporter ATP-binding protein, partial [Alkalihalophilus lindianensis]|nr:peptide ABC transporter ATP-binding protein [Alkalihalophilus lindianensis]
QITSDSENEEKLSTIPGTPPDLREPIPGCHFADRCPYAQEVCFSKKPELIEVEEGHTVSCHFQTKEKRLKRKEKAYHG